MPEYKKTTVRQDNVVDLERAVGATISKYYENGYDLEGYEEDYEDVSEGTTKVVELRFSKGTDNPDYRGEK